jgi:hypothetical protein
MVELNTSLAKIERTCHPGRSINANKLMVNLVLEMLLSLHRNSSLQSELNFVSSEIIANEKIF